MDCLFREEKETLDKDRERHRKPPTRTVGGVGTLEREKVGRS